MQKDRSWKKADYPNIRPAWKKVKTGKDPLEGFVKVHGFVTSRSKADGVAKGLKAMGAKKTKIIGSGGYFDIYYKK